MVAMGAGRAPREGMVSGWRAWVGLAVLVLLTGVSCAAKVEKESPSQGGSGGGGEGAVLETTSDKLDLLLVVDNSRSMAQMQQLLQLAMSDLLGALVNPPCVDNGLIVETPADPAAPCSTGSRAYSPVTDVHIGVLSSSLGGHGADSCSDTVSAHFSANDKAHLLSRISTDSSTLSVATWQDTGFLVWDPTASSHTPPGHADIAALQGQLNDILGGVGELGCGLEATLESWYRFLVDPDPYQSIEVQDGLAVTLGTDEELLAQRHDFLRPDSLVSIIMISNENDCSIRDGGYTFWAAQLYVPGTNQPFRMDRPRAACGQDPNDPCCRSCAQPPGDGCDTSADDCSGTLSGATDHFNLRCFDQKRRFGVDMLYPIVYRWFFKKRVLNSSRPTREAWSRRAPSCAAIRAAPSSSR